MLAIIFGYLFIAVALMSSATDFIPYKEIVKKFWFSFKIDCMAVGGIFAIVLYQNNKLLKYLLNNFIFYTTTILTIVLIIKGVHIKMVQAEIYSILFGIIILNFAANKKIKISLENRVFNFLGNISYGLYMYHPIAIVLALTICKSIQLTSNWLIYPASFLITILLSSNSYNYFEKPFLKYKSKFSKIISGNEIKK